MSGGTQKVDNSYSRQPMFTVPGTESFADSLLSRSQQNLFGNDQVWRDQGLNFFSDVLSGEAPRFRPSGELNNLINSVRETSDLALPQELANARSQYYRGPAGRSMMALDDTLLQNRIGRDANINSLLQGQYNQDMSFMGSAATNLMQGGAQDFSEAMQIADLLIGEKGRGSQNSSSGISTGSMLGGVGGILGGIGSMASGGLFSDRRLKTNIRKLGESFGLPVYSFNYLWNLAKDEIGFMADEVRKVYPEAVRKIGIYDAVDYSSIVNMNHS